MIIKTPTKENIEKLYKLGTQDWLDFYNAIRSHKQGKIYGRVTEQVDVEAK